MPTAFETFVNDELPNRVATQEASVGANTYPRYTGTAKLTTARTAAQLRTDINAETFVINYIISGGASAITTGVKGYVPINFPCDIFAWDMFCEAAPTTTDLVIDIKKCSYAGFPGSLASITGSDPPRLNQATSDRKRQSSALTGWTKSWGVAFAMDVLEISVTTAPGTTTLATLTLEMKRV